jgi:hypothetical protein
VRRKEEEQVEQEEEEEEEEEEFGWVGGELNEDKALTKNSFEAPCNMSAALEGCGAALEL